MMIPRFVFLFIYVLCMLDFSSAQVTDNDPKSFAHAFVRILRTKDPDSMKAITHPKTLFCWRAAQQGLHDMLVRQSRHNFGSRYKISVTPISKNRKLLMDNGVTYPVRPSHTLQIDFEGENYSGVTMVMQVVKEWGRWYQVLPCPSPEMIPHLDSIGNVRDLQEEQAKKLFADLKDPLRSEVVALAKQGKRIEAIQKLASATGEELWVARRVVEMLVPSR